MAGSGPKLPFLGLEPTQLAAERALRGCRVVLTVTSLVMFFVCPVLGVQRSLSRRCGGWGWGLPAPFKVVKLKSN